MANVTILVMTFTLFLEGEMEIGSAASFTLLLQPARQATRPNIGYFGDKISVK